MSETPAPVDLAAARQRIERAYTELGDVCAQGPSRRFKMHIPADPARDTDLIISAALNDADLLVSEVERLRATVARVRALRDYLATATGDTETGDLLRKVARNLSDAGTGAVSSEPPSEAERVRLQAADILARLFPSIECVLLDHADQLDDEKGRVDANLAELAYVYRELTGFDACTATEGTNL